MDASEKKTFVIGLTGGIGSGKSTVTNFLANQGLYVFDCDEAVHQRYTDVGILKVLESKLGCKLGDNPRAIVAAKILEDPTLLSFIEDIFGKALEVDLKNFLIEARSDDQRLAILDAPTLFEHGFADKCDFIITICTPMNLRRERILARPNMTVEKLDFILSRQWTDDQRVASSSHIIYNIGTIEDAEQQAAEIIQDIEETIKWATVSKPRPYTLAALIQSLLGI